MKLAVALLIGLTLGAFAHGQDSRPSPPAPTSNDRIDVQAKLKTIKGGKNFIVKYDKFKDYTSVLSKPINLLGTGEAMAVAFARGLGNGPYGRGPERDLPPSRFVLSIGFGFNGKELNEKPLYGLVFGTDSNNWNFLKDHTLYALIDEERLQLGEGVHDGNVYFGGVTEQMIFSLTKEQVEKFANGKSVEIKIGGFERKLKPDVVSRFRDLLSLSQPAAPH